MAMASRSVVSDILNKISYRVEKFLSVISLNYSGICVIFLGVFTDVDIMRVKGLS